MMPQGGLNAGTSRRKVVMYPHRGSYLQVDILGLKSCRWGGIPQRRRGVSKWTHQANGEGSCPPLCGPETEH